MNVVLLCGFPKVGNTWNRFFLMNYYNILNHGATETLTYEELSTIQCHRVERDVNKSTEQFGYSPFKFEEGFPPMYHTHVAANWKYGHYFDKFDEICYLYRNPYDTMISYHKYLSNRKNPFQHFPEKKQKAFMELEVFSKYAIRKYTQHIQKTYKKATMFLSYEELKGDSYIYFRRLLELFDVPIKEEIIEKSIKMSSFGSIKQMGRDTNRKCGLSRGYQGEFTRDGRVGQYKDVMSPELIRYIGKKWKPIKQILNEIT